MSAVLKMLRRQRASKRRAPSRRPRWALLFLACAVLAAAGAVGFALREIVLSPWLRVRHLTVRGTERLTAGDFRAVLGREMNTPLLLVDLERCRRTLERHPGVAAARVARRLPGTLEALVAERRALARTTRAGRPVLVDREGMLFTSERALPGDAQLPEIRGVALAADMQRLAPRDRPAVDALVALARVLGGPPPPDTVVDLTPRDRIVLRPGRDAPILWLDRERPEQNLESLFERRTRVAEIVPGASVDLRFPHRLTLVPPPEPGPDGSAAE